METDDVFICSHIDCQLYLMILLGISGPFVRRRNAMTAEDQEGATSPRTTNLGVTVTDVSRRAVPHLAVDAHRRVCWWLFDALWFYVCELFMSEE